jgi:DNA-binding transcriptional ArsR family regulator
VIRIHFTADDLADVRFAPRPAPLQVLHTALMRLTFAGADPLLGRWRHRLLRTAPEPMHRIGDLVPDRYAPSFLDVFDETLPDALETLRSAHPDVVRAELARAYAGLREPAPAWVRGLYAGDDGARELLLRAERAAFDHVVRPVWPLVQDLHRAELARHALAVAEHGIGATLGALVPGAGWGQGVWELDDGTLAGDCDARKVDVDGRGVVLMPTFHWAGGPLVADLPGRPVVVTYPAGPGLPPTPDGAGTEGALAAVVGRTRAEILQLLAEERTTGELARALGVSAPTVSAHTAALRAAGLLTTTRDGRVVRHRRTPTATLLLGRHAAL